MVATRIAGWKRTVWMRRFAWLVLAVAVAFAAGMAAGSRLHGGGPAAVRRSEPSGPARVGPPPLSQDQANAIAESAVRRGTTFVAYITGPVDPRVAAHHRCDDAAQQEACDERSPEFPETKAHGG